MRKGFGVLLCLCILFCSVSLAEPVTVDLSTASVSELEALIASFEERIVELKAEELAKYAEIDDMSAVSLDGLVGQSIQFPSKVIQVAEGIGSVQALTAWNGYEEHPFLVTYMPSETLPMVMVGDSVRVYGDVSGITPVNGVDTVAMTAAIIESIPSKDLKAVQETAEEGYEAHGDYSARKYTWSTSSYGYAALAVKSNASDDQKFIANIIFKDDAGNMVGVKSREIDVLDPGQTSIIIASNDTAFADFDYEITSESSYYRGINAGLRAEVVNSAGKIIVSLTNDGTAAAEFVEGYALFFKDNEVVGYDSTYFTDSDNEIKPGETIMEELKSYNEFDAYELYFDGRGEK